MTNPIRTNTSTLRRAFSLLEILVVLGILIIVMSIVIPALGSARNAAKKSSTQGVMAAVTTSIGQFKMDQARLPGYFTARELGDNNNDLSAMENIMLDLAGGITTAAESGGADVCDVINGPQVVSLQGGNAPAVHVEIGRIGATGQDAKGILAKGYFKPDAKFFVRQCLPGQRVVNQAKRAAMPVLVDAWGSPILAWSQDEVPPSNNTFGKADSSTRARFYLASNRTFLQATSLGKLGIRQPDPDSGSLLSMNPVQSENALGALLGNPAFPNPDTNNATPAAARAPIVLHSAGINGVYLGRAESGGKRAAATGGLVYTANEDRIIGGAFDDFLDTAQ